MTKDELAVALAGKTGQSKSQSLHAIAGVMEIMSDAFSKGNDVYLRGFGTFKVVHRKARQGRNIAKNTAVAVPEKNVVKFIPSKIIKDKIK